ncbi:MAG: PDZ domain-containing protein, partial [Anaerolineae bacterium]|nr:PDZ domain-containing protein [Anaerolineae bacterium]
MAERAMVGMEPWPQRHLVLGIGAVCLLLLLASWSHTLARPDLPVVWGPDLRVQHLEPGTEAHRAGLAEGDRLLAVAGQEVATPGDLQRVLALHRPGEVIPCTVARRGQVVTLEAPLGRPLLPISTRLSWLSGLLFGAVGTWVYLRRLESPAIRQVWLLHLAGMLVLGLGGSVWPPAQVVHIAAAAVLGGLTLHLGAVFPQVLPRLRKHVGWLYLPGILGGLWGLLGYAQSGGRMAFGHQLGAAWALWGWTALCGVALVLVLARAYRRVRKPSLRRQVEWLAWGGGLALAGAAYHAGNTLVLGPDDWHGSVAILASVQMPLSALAAFGWEGLQGPSLSQVLRRAAIYSVMALAFCSALFLGLTLTLLLPGHEGVAPRTIWWGALALLLALVAAFEPMLRAVERGVDRLFFRRQGRWREVLQQASRELRAVGRVRDVAALLTEWLPPRLGVRDACVMLFDPLDTGKVLCFPKAEGGSVPPEACRRVATWLREQPSLWQRPLLLAELDEEPLA